MCCGGVENVAFVSCVGRYFKIFHEILPPFFCTFLLGPSVWSFPCRFTDRTYIFNGKMYVTFHTEWFRYGRTDFRYGPYRPYGLCTRFGTVSYTQIRLL